MPYIPKSELIQPHVAATAPCLARRSWRVTSCGGGAVVGRGEARGISFKCILACLGGWSEGTVFCKVRKREVEKMEASRDEKQNG